MLASRLQIGNIRPVGDDPTNVPFSKKYFLGGATSIRGWGRYEVSPLASGLPIGGNSMLAFSEELRAVLHGNLGGVLFFDAGQRLGRVARASICTICATRSVPGCAIRRRSVRSASISAIS